MKIKQSQADSERSAVIDTTRIVSEDILSQQCLVFQKRRAYIIGPVMLLTSIWVYWATRVWQVAVIVGLMVMTNILFFIGLWFARRKAIEKTLWLAMIPTLVVCMSVVAFVDGLDVAITLTAVSLVVQSSVFSRRVSLAGVIGIVLIVLMGQAIDAGLLFNRLQGSTNVAFIASSIVAIVMIAQFWVYHRKHYENAQMFISELHGFIRQREQILTAVSNTIPSVEKSVNETTGISRDVAERAKHQSEAIEQITDILTALTTGASTTTNTAQQTVRVSEGIEELMRENYSRLQDVSNTSKEVVSNMHDARIIMGTLVGQTENVEKILSYNRGIGEQIKVLSVNASIEAAEAGEFGTGFAVVARELTEMIDSTEKNLFETSEMLNDIRRQSNLGMAAIDATTRMLEQFFRELSLTRKTIDNAIVSAQAAARQTQHVVQSIEKQSEELIQVGQGTQALLDNSFELAVNASLLQDTVLQLDHLRESLSDMAGKTVKETQFRV